MGRSLFVDLIDSEGGHGARRRSWTVPVSVIVHAAAIGAVLTLPRPTASEPEPEPPRIGAFETHLQATPTPEPQPVRVQILGSRQPPRDADAAPAPRGAIRVPPDEPTGLLPAEPNAPATATDARLCVDCDPSPGTFGGTGPPEAEGTGASGDGAPLPVGGDVHAPVKIRNVAPAYPEIARRAGIGGKVVLECTIDASGKVTDIRVVSGNTLFVPAALEAVRQWLYDPTRLNGQPVAVLMTVTVHFSPRR